MSSVERAERLLFVVPHTEVPLTGVGGWRFRVVGQEIQLRNRRLPHLRMDLLLTEAADLESTLQAAIVDLQSRPVVRLSWWRRAADWLARRTWRRQHAEEQAAALEQLAKEFEESRGGWG